MSTFSLPFLLPPDDAAIYLALAILSALGLYRLLVLPRSSADVQALPCPGGSEVLWGHERIIFECASGIKYTTWFEELGSVYRIKGALFHPDIIVLADPTAINHVLTTHEEKYVRPSFSRQIFTLIAGKSIVWAEGPTHKRFRKQLEPAFSTAAVRGMVNDVLDYSKKLEDSLATYLKTCCDEGQLNIVPWIESATLDVIGRVGFGYDFRESPEGWRVKESAAGVMNNMLSPAAFYAEALIRAIPLLLSLPLAVIGKAGEVKASIRKLTKSVMNSYDHGYDADTSIAKKNVLEFLLNATGEGKMTEEEIGDNISAVFLAGYETTAVNLSMIFYELAQNIACQDKLRDELANLGRDPCYEDLLGKSALPYLDAVIKEGLRLYPPLPNNIRVTTESDVIPLDEPIKTPSGKVLREIRVEAGQTIYIPTNSVNRLSTVWGDANVFRPERWIEPDGLSAKVRSQNGWSNILSFGTGPRTCVGYRLALLEMKCVIAVLMRSFQFHATSAEVEMKSSFIVVPHVVGEEDKGVRVPLYVTLIAGDRQDMKGPD